jgi:hypothetical protein
VKRVLTESTIVMELADEICRRIAHRVMRVLQGMKGHGLSGDDSGLKSAWDEICVQVQFEQSVFWDAYEHTVTSLVAGYEEGLKPFEREAVWLQSPEGVRWSCDDDGEREPDPVVRDEAVDYIVREYVYADAGRWSNHQIREYLDRAGSSD